MIMTFNFQFKLRGGKNGKKINKAKATNGEETYASITKHCKRGGINMARRRYSKGRVTYGKKFRTRRGKYGCYKYINGKKVAFVRK